MSVTESTNSPSSVLSTIVSTIKSLVNLEATGVAEAIGVFVTAREAIRTVASGVAAAATQSVINTANAKYTGVPLTPAELADMVVRNVVPDSTGAAGMSGSGYPAPRLSGIADRTASQEAAFSGLSEDRFAALVADSGESYGIVDALRLWNRGRYMYGLDLASPHQPGQPLYDAGSNLGTKYGITEAELDSVIAYSRVRPEFTPDLLKLAKDTISPADAVELVVKQVISKADGLNLYQAGGGAPEQFDALVDAAGDSAGVEKAVELTAHGVITAEELLEIVGMSRLNPRFYYLTQPNATGHYPLNYKWLDPYQISEALKAGTVTAETAMSWMLANGYPTDQASAFATSSATATVATVKQDTATQVLKEFGAHMLSADETTSALSALGYTKASIPVLMAQATATAIIAARNSAVSRVRASYLIGQTTAASATTELATLGIPQAAITAYLADWAVEYATPHEHLSAAQVGKLAEDGILSEAQAVAKWVAMGYSTDDAALLLYIYPPGSKAPTAPAPGTTESEGTTG